MAKRKSRSASTEAGSPDFAALASQMNGLLDQLVALIPDYTQPDPESVPKVSGNARFANELIAPTVTAIANYEPLRQHNLFDVEAGRQALAARDEFRPVAARMAAVTAALNFTVDSKLAHAAMETLQTYQWAKRHAEAPEGAALRPYVAEMKRVVAKTINRRPKGQSSPAPGAPSPIAQPPAAQQ